MADQPPPARGTVGPTRWPLLGGVFAIGTALGFALVTLTIRASGSAPRIQWSSAVGLLAITTLVGWFAYTTYRSLHRDHQRIDAARAVNLLMLAKASALAGALMAGGYVGFAVPFLDDLEIPLPRERAIRAGIAALCAVALVIAAMLLERACRVPKVEDG